MVDRGAIVATTAAVLLAALLAGCGERAAMPRVQPSAKSDDLKTAFAVAFGGPAPAIRIVERNGDPTTLRYRPVKLLTVGDHLVLISESQTDGCHSCYGSLAIHYLKRAGGGLQVTGAWPEIADGASFGDPPRWALRSDLFQGPALEVSAGGTWQGCTVEYAQLVELADDRPILRVKRVLTAYDGPGGEIAGKLRPETKGAAFAVDYDGERPHTVEYRPTGEAFEPVHAEPDLPSC
jgi:hypothetical protein